MKKSTKSQKSVKSTKSTLKKEGRRIMKKSTKSQKSVKSTKSPSIEELRALLAMLESEQASEQASEESESEESERASEESEESESEASGKAPRTYEFAAIGAEFCKEKIGAVPQSERAREYYTRQANLCERVLSACDAPIAPCIMVGKMKVKDIISLCDEWVISPMAMRVVLQLSYPIVTVCCADTERIARDIYGIGRANSLMGSRHNTSMYAKAKDKSCALPFRRVSHNLTALGLDFAPVDNVGDCNFCDNKKSFQRLVTLCDYWLNTCDRKQASKQASKKASKKASRDGDNDNNNDIMSKLRALLNI